MFNPKSQRIYQFIVLNTLLLFVISPSLAQGNLDFNKGKLLLEISDLVKAHFYDSTLVGETWDRRVENHRKALAEVATLDQFDSQVNELLKSLNTSHTYFFTRNNPKRYQLLGVFNRLYDKNDTSLFCYEGIGIDTRTVDDKVFVVSVYDGLPADEAGLMFGDQIVSIDGEAFHPIKSFLRKTNTPVAVDLIRDNRRLQVDVPVRILDGRTMFEKSLEASMQIFERNEKKIGYAHLWSYAGTKYQEQLRAAVLWGDLSQCDALIVDLRDGWGGADINYLNLFRKPIATIKSTPRKGSPGSYSGVWEKPVALITNERSTSGKELFAYGFRKLELGKIIGEQTAGAVVAGRIFLLSSGDLLYLAVNDVHIDGKRLEGVGVMPDVRVNRPIGSTGDDTQLASALKELSK